MPLSNTSNERRKYPSCVYDRDVLGANGGWLVSYVADPQVSDTHPSKILPRKLSRVSPQNRDRVLKSPQIIKSLHSQDRQKDLISSSESKKYLLPQLGEIYIDSTQIFENLTATKSLPEYAKALIQGQKTEDQ